MAVGSLEYVNIDASRGFPPCAPCATWTPASWAGLMCGLFPSALLLGSEEHLYMDWGG